MALEFASTKPCRLLGVDIDPVLIERASQNPSDRVEFTCLDVMGSDSSSALESYLKAQDRTAFSITFAFSVTMWIHLNHGDEGLVRFLREASQRSRALVVEPQPWKCYRSAVRRMRKLREDVFPEWHGLKIRNSVEDEIEKILVEQCGLVKTFESEKTAWGRKIFVFEKR